MDQTLDRDAGQARLLPETGPVGARAVTWRRLRGPSSTAALTALVLGSIGTSVGAVVAGRLAEGVTPAPLALLALCLLGGAVLDTCGRFLWAGVVDRAEGRLRHDLLDAALAQPLAALSEQAVGEVLDRVDDDTREVGSLLRIQVWSLLRALATTGPILIIAALTWWPAAVALPLCAVATAYAVRPLLPAIAERKVREEAAWTDHAAALEEGIAGRDEVRTSLGQAFAIQRLAGLSAQIHRLFLELLRLERRLSLRAGLMLHGLLALIALSATALAAAGTLSVAQLVTLFLVTSTLIGHLARVADQWPELQAGLGAVLRIRDMMAVAPEPSGGCPVPDGALGLEFRDTSFAYAEGSFALRGVSLELPAGQTLALVGRTGSGKSTLASLVSRAVEPRPGTVLLGGVDVLDLDLGALRRSVGVVTQRTEILAGTLAQNITLFADMPRARVEAVVHELGLNEWVQGLDDGLDTPLGPGGRVLSAGEEQLLAFARLLLRDVGVVILDEATARMDPVTEARVVAASQRLLAGRTGILIAHRLSTIARADMVAVLADGALTQCGPRARLEQTPGPFRDLLSASDASWGGPAAATPGIERGQVGAVRRRGEPPPRPDTGSGPSLARGVWSMLTVRPQWGLLSVGLFLGMSLTGALGTVTGYAWGHTVAALGEGEPPWAWLALSAASIIVGPLFLAAGVIRYPRWWVEVLLRVRMSVLVGQTGQRRLERVPAGEVVARALDSDRYARYADRWVDVTNGLLFALSTGVAAASPMAALVVLAIMAVSASAAALGRGVAGRSAASASATRARFGRALVSVLESARTVKLSDRIGAVRAHLTRVDAGRVSAAVREHRVQALLDGVPTVMIQVGSVSAWVGVLLGWWGLATALLVVAAVNGFDWFGRVAGAVVTEAPGTRAWQVATSRMAGGVDLMSLPDGVDLLTGAAPAPPLAPRRELTELSLRGFSAVHEDGTIGVERVDLDVHAGELVLLVGQVGSGKSSLLRALAGLVDHRGELRWNGDLVRDPETFLRPGQVSYVAQVPRVLSGTFAQNVQLAHERGFDVPVSDARLDQDVERAGGAHSLVGHRGVRLSGGQVQRLALARALAADAELLLADDVSSALDARTELELWQALRARGATVIGSASKRAALAKADVVVVLVEGRVAEQGPWATVSERWGHLAG